MKHNSQNSTRLTKLPLLALLAAVLCLSPSARAADVTWTNVAAANWATTTAWSPNGVPIFQDVAFFTNTTAANAPSVAANTSIGALVFSNSTTFGAGASTLSISNAYAFGTTNAGIFINSAAGAVSLGSAKIALLENQTWINNSASLLTLLGGLDPCFDYFRGCGAPISQ